MESRLQHSTCKPQHQVLIHSGKAGQPFLGGWELALHTPRGLGSSGDSWERSLGTPCQHDSEKSASAVWVEIRDTLGLTEALRSWVAPSRGLKEGWPGWCWVRSELGTAWVAGHLST